MLGNGTAPPPNREEEGSRARTGGEGREGGREKEGFAGIKKDLDRPTAKCQKGPIYSKDIIL